ncbi:MAG: exodeoxyribonuclease VII small subunit [Patescibacteria group bacterium]|jgi:exodeoxyribonuclease VII small subunit
MSKKKIAGEEIDFGQAYGELESIVAWFEREDTDLDESLAKFERGLTLVRQCKERLQAVENRVSEIKSKFREEQRPEAGQQIL